MNTTTSNHFHISRFRIEATVVSTIRIPGFKGFSLRDCFQQALVLYSSCPDTYATEACQSCKKNGRCLYQKMFRPTIPDDNPTARAFSQNPPVSFAFDPIDLSKNDYETGESFIFDFILFGNNHKLIKKLIPVFQLMGEVGIGSRKSGYKQRGKFSINSILNFNHLFQSKILFANNQLTPYFKPYLISLKSFSGIKSNNSPITLNFVHPLMIFKKNNLLSKELETADILNNICSRITLLSNIHGDIPYEKALVTAEYTGNEHIINRKLHLNIYRYSSSRQKKIIYYKAVRGQLSIENLSRKNIELLYFGTHIFIGRNTSSGFGKYLIQ